MDLTLNEDKIGFQRLAREFLDKEVVPHRAGWDRRESVHTTIIPKLGEKGGGTARRAGTRLGEDLRKTLPWPGTERPGRLGPPLVPFATAATPWTAQDITIVLTDLAQRHATPGS